MTTHPSSRRIQLSRIGFTLVELLIGMTIVAILAGLITVAAGGVFRNAREFAVKTEMNQIEQAIEQFRIEYNFYPPSFKEFAAIEAASGPVDAATHMLTYLNRIAPNHAESAPAPSDPMLRRIDIWWGAVGTNLANAAANPGADLVFWLSGLSKNRQFPLTNLAGAALAAHNEANDGVERQVFFDFKDTQLNVTGSVANYSQSNRKFVPYQYLDAGNYLPSAAGATDGAYANSNQKLLAIYGDQMTVDGVLDSILDGTITAVDFQNCYPNADSFQLVTFGLDSMPGVATAPNLISSVMNFGADNIVNFGKNGPTRLDVVLVED